MEVVIAERLSHGIEKYGLLHTNSSGIRKRE